MKVLDKSNEITAIPALLELLDIVGCIITIDAMGTQTAIAERIIAKHADYVLSIKANHPTLYAQVKQWFEAAQARNFAGIEHAKIFPESYAKVQISNKIVLISIFP